MGTYILLALLQTQLAAPQAPEAQDRARPRLMVGAHFSGLAVNLSEGGHTGLGAGANASIPVGGRTAIDLRATHLLPAEGYGLYDIRWRRLLKAPRNGKPDYFAVGVAGFYYVSVRYRGTTRHEERRISYPQMVSLATGWDIPTGRGFAVPLEAGVLLHPYGLVVGTISTGVTWGPESRRQFLRSRRP
ncbi:MAG TPA: hypothetical protein VFZ36_13705 [Vicinamibacterales bacterium]